MKKLTVITLMLTMIVLMNVVGLTQETLASVQHKLEEIGQILNKATLEGDYETLLKYHTDDAIIKADMRPAIKGKSALREEFEKNKKAGARVHSFSTATEAMWICGDEVYERGTFGQTASYKDSPKPIAVYGSYFEIWLKQTDGSYKIKYLIWNLDFNPYESR